MLCRLIQSHYMNLPYSYLYYAVAGLTLFIPGSLLNAAPDLKSVAAITTHFFENHCYECHDEDSNKGDLNLYELSLKLDSQQQAQQWAQIFKKIESGEMPPKKKKRPTKTDKKQLLSALV